MPHSLFSTDTDLTAENLLRLPAEFGCPVWVYDAQIIRRQIAALKQFDVVRFAQKACSNIHILRLMREQGVKVDSVSLGEIERALAAGYNPQTHPDDIVFTADVIDQATLERVSERSLVAVARASADFADFAAFIKEKASSVLQAPCADVALRGVPLHIAKRRYHLPLAYMGDVAQRFRAEIG